MYQRVFSACTETLLGTVADVMATLALQSVHYMSHVFQLPTTRGHYVSCPDQGNTL